MMYEAILVDCEPSPNIILLQKLVFESSEAVSVVSTFDDLGLKEDLLRGIYAYSAFKMPSLDMQCI